ncbi:hybrid sensor histidine kinase/response regulator [Novilysobacter selenitireducens]|uniref:histidine kinase n=1 Tax=Novilysobacter selenitireducens TaxID=2872639 RepID=A0ABS7T4X4_9GAMM|nr:ATP-binding protein [Lysobacter selenitireducens]MBZ4038930.1 response regulator [Lysobacter selenitireducens]
MDPTIARRVVMLLPTQRDTELTSDVLARHGIDTYICRQHADLAREIDRGAAAVLVAEEALLQGAQSVLVRAIEIQPRWSDLPVLVVARDGADSVQVADAMARLGNVTLLERPLRISTLVSTVKSALRARERQYQMLTHLDELEQARDAIAASAQRKDEFLAMLAHELRNPLAPIRNALHLLGESAVPEQERASLRAMMKRQVDHMVRLVDDLVEVSRLSRGTIELRRDMVELADVLRNAIDLSRPLIDTGRHALHLDLPDEALPVDADPVRLAQVFGNLLNNAAKYARKGGEIRVGARRDGDEVVVSVLDRGIGIEPDVLPHVFELFTQGRREAHRAQDGLGIGLTLVRSLVEMHGGTVTAHSDGRGHGAEFIVRLPLATARAGAADSPHPDSHPAQTDDAPGAEHPLRVLVVDDNVDAARSLGMVLQMLEIEHEVCFDGPTALEAVRRCRPDAVLLDIGMPGMDGYEVARQLHDDPANQDISLVAVTGWSQLQDKERTQQAGFSHHFSKPVDIGALQALLGELRASNGRHTPDEGDSDGDGSDAGALSRVG